MIARRTTALAVGAVTLALILACSQQSQPSVSSRPSTEPAILTDVEMIVGGNFTPDGVGPDVHRQTLERLHQRPAGYLATFAEMYAGERCEPRKWADLYLASFLRHTQKDQPQQTGAVAARLIERFDAVLYTFDESRDREAFLKLLSPEAARVVQRLDRQRAELRALSGAK